MKSLGLDKPAFEPNESSSRKAAPTKKRKTPDDAGATQPAPKVQRIASVSSESGVRRSSRNSGKVVDYKAELQIGSPVPLSHKNKSEGNTGPLGREGGSIRKYDPSVNLAHEIQLSDHHSVGKHLDLYLMLRLEHGGSPGRAAVLIPFTRMSS